MTDVVNRMKPEPGPCECGCGLVGRPKVKAWANGCRCNRGCGCRRCVGGRQTAKARKRENRIARELGLERSPMSGQLTGVDVGGYWEIEETANAALTRGLFAWWGVEADPGEGGAPVWPSWDGPEGVCGVA